MLKRETFSAEQRILDSENLRVLLAQTQLLITGAGQAIERSVMPLDRDRLVQLRRNLYRRENAILRTINELDSTPTPGISGKKESVSRGQIDHPAANHSRSEKVLAAILQANREDADRGTEPDHRAAQ